MRFGGGGWVKSIQPSIKAVRTFCCFCLWIRVTLKNNYQVISERNELSEIPVMNRIDFVKSSAKRRDERRDSLSLHNVKNLTRRALQPAQNIEDIFPLHKTDISIETK